MIESDKKTFSEDVIRLLSAFGRMPDALALSAWWDAVSDLELAHVRAAVVELLRRQLAFPPDPPRLRAIAIGIAERGKATEQENTDALVAKLRDAAEKASPPPPGGYQAWLEEQSRESEP